MKVLITGVAGFIGSSVAKALLDKGYHVVGIDNMSQGDKLNMLEFVDHPEFEMHYLDIRDEAAVKAASRGCKKIVHLAAYKIPRYTDALDTLLINSGGSENVLKAAIDQNAKVVAASTSDVYGKNPDVPAPSYAYVKPESGAEMLDLRVSYNPMSYYLIKKVEWTAFRRRPWTGIGLMAFPFESERAFDEGRLHSPYQRINAHSTPIGRLAETGLVGLAGLIALVVVAWRSGLAAAHHGPGADVAWALLAGCLGLLVNSINVDMMHFRFLWFGLGILRTLSHEASDHDAR